MTIEGAIWELCQMNDSKDIPDYYKPTLTKVIETIEMDGRPKHGRWIDDYDDYIGYMPRCSVCGKKVLYSVSFDLKGNRHQMNHCPNCGASMDEVEE